MSDRPRVSVIMPFLNSGRFLHEAIESVLAQTYDHWELRMVNDGSTDDSGSIADEFVQTHPGRIYCHHHDRDRNLGTAASRNLAASRAQGALLAFLDADDVWLPGTLTQQLSLLHAYAEAGVVYGASEYWHSWTGDPADQEKDEIPDLGVEPEVVFVPPTLAVVNYPLGEGPAPSINTVMIRREAFDRVGGFEETFTGIHRMYEDQAFLTKLYLNCQIVVGAECWDRYRQHRNSMCARVTEEGRYPDVRLHFLNWCQRYLDERRLVDPDVRKALTKARRASDSGRESDADGRLPAASSPAASWRQHYLDEGEANRRLDLNCSDIRNVLFGEHLYLLGATATRMTTGGLKVELIWKSEAPQSLRRFVAVHVVDENGVIHAQADYPQDRGIVRVAAAAVWRDAIVLSPAQLRGAHAVAVGVFESGGDLLPATGGRGDWGGRRVWLRVPE